MSDDATAPDLSSYERSEFSDGPWTRPIYRKGSGPAVIIIHEMPGLHPLVVRFADRVAAAGMTVVLPSLFGTPGREISKGYATFELLKGICIRREFNVWRGGRSSPIVDWLRALARALHEECGGAGVGAVGMCFTGGFALAMMTEPAVIAPVLSQPSLPLAIGIGGKARACAIDASDQEIRMARERLEKEDRKLLGLRFVGDPLVPEARFEYLKEQLGERFEEVALDPADAAPDDSMPAHSVLTVHLNDADPDGPTRALERRVIGFFGSALNESGAA